MLEELYQSGNISLHLPYTKCWTLRRVDIQRLTKPLHNAFGRDVLRQGNNRNNARCTIDTVEYPSSFNKRIPLCELNLLRLVSPVQLCLRRTGIYTRHMLRSCSGLNAAFCFLFYGRFGCVPRFEGFILLKSRDRFSGSSAVGYNEAIYLFHRRSVVVYRHFWEVVMVWSDQRGGWGMGVILTPAKCLQNMRTCQTSYEQAHV